MKKNNLIIVFILFVSTSFCQEFKKISSQEFLTAFEHVTEAYGDYFQLNYQQEIFLNSTDTVPYYLSKGLYQKGSGNEYKNSTNGQFTVQTSELKIVVDSLEQEVYLLKPDTLLNSSFITPFGFEQMFGDFTQIYLSENKTIETYKVVFENSDFEYEFVEIKLTKKTDQFLQIKIQLRAANYYAEALEDAVQESPLIVISYSPIKSKSLSATDFQLQNYLSVEGGKYSLRNNWSDFTLHDLRYRE